MILRGSQLLCLWSVIFATLFLSPLFSQETPSPPPEKTLPEGDPAVIPLEADSSVVEEQKQSERLTKDIATAGYFDLLGWVESAGLDTSGDANTLRKRLYDFYSLKAPPSGSSKRDTIIIESAAETRYFEVQSEDGEEGQNYIQLSGKVRLTLKEAATGTEHIVQADQVFFNRTVGAITASGNIQYTRITASKEERFVGDSLVFKVSNWNGIIFKGIVERKRAAQKGEVEAEVFYFKGDILKKGEGEVMILEKGRISTDNIAHPYFSINAHRMWITGPDEWGLLSAVLYIGHVPVLYIPFYYFSGNEMIFHPVLGLEERYGNHILTTLYLLGERRPKDDEEDGALSFLPVAESGDNFAVKREGLYLMKKKGKKETSVHSLKIMNDYYTKLGVFSGVEGEFKNIDLAKSISALRITSLFFFAGIGVSRVLDSENSVYLYDNEKRFYYSEWVDTTLFKETVPFRYGTSFKMNSQYLNLDFQYYSDPLFRFNFLNRKEQFEWSSYLLNKVQSQEDYQGLSDTERFAKEEESLSEKRLYNFSWTLSSDINFPVQQLNPVISRASLDLDIKADWKTKDDSEFSQRGYDPRHQFYYLESVTLPGSTLDISGTLWPIQGTQKKSDPPTSAPVAEEEPRQGPPSRIFSPYESEEKSEDKEEILSEENSLKNPLLQKDMPQQQGFDWFSFKSTYSIEAKNNITNQTDSENWNTIKSIDNKMKQGIWANDNNVNLDLSFNAVDGIFSLSIKSHLDSYYKEVFDLFKDSTPLDENTRKAAERENRIQIKETAVLSVNPLKHFEWFKDSYLRYSLAFKLYDYSFDFKEKEEYKEEWVDWTDEKEWVTTHSLSSAFDFHPIRSEDNWFSDLHFKASTSHKLKPHDVYDAFDFFASAEFFDWENKFEWSIDHIPPPEDQVGPRLDSDGNVVEDWQLRPFTHTSIFQPINEIRVQNTFIYDVKEDRLQSNNSSLTLWWLTATVNASHSQPYAWNKDTLKWEKDGDEKFQLNTIKFNVKGKTDPAYLWKNRISFSFGTGVMVEQDFVRINQKSLLDMTLDFNFSLFEFLDLTFSYKMGNNYLYLYSAAAREKFGIVRKYDFFEDLGNSFSLFNKEYLEETRFKMKSITLTATHHLHDWDMIFEFSGKPEIKDKISTWDPSFSVFISWKPIPLFKRRVELADEEWSTKSK